MDNFGCDPKQAYSDLPPSPDHAYRWDTFAADQPAQPLIFHGTSAVYEDSIREDGLGIRRAPFSPGEIGRVVEIFDRYHLVGPRGEIGVLKSYTAASLDTGSVSYTFDYTRACWYASRYRGGETVHNLSLLLNWAVEPLQVEFTRAERDVLVSCLGRLKLIVSAHRPMVAGVMFSPDLFSGRDLEFFSDRRAFETMRDDLLGLARFIGYRAPHFSVKGHEYLATKPISAERIRCLLFPDPSPEQLQRMG